MLRSAPLLSVCATTASSQATSPTSAPCHERLRVSPESAIEEESETNNQKQSSAITVRALVMFRPIAQPCASVVRKEDAATAAASLVILPATAQLLTLLLLLLPPLHEGEEVSEAATTVSRTTEQLHATSAVVLTTTLETARHKP